MRRRTGLIALDELVELAGLAKKCKKMTHPKKKILPKVLNRPNGPACQIWQKKMTHPKKIFFCQKSYIGQMDLPAKYGEPSSMGTS